MTFAEALYRIWTVAFSVSLVTVSLLTYIDQTTDPIFSAFLVLFALFLSRKGNGAVLPSNDLRGDFLITMFAVFRLSLVEALCIGLVGVSARCKPKDLTQVNVLRYVLALSCTASSVVLSKLFYDFFSDYGPAEMFLIVTFASGAIYSLTTTGLGTGIESLLRMESFPRLWGEALFRSLPLFAFGAGLAGILCLIVQVTGHPIAMLLTLVFIAGERFHNMNRCSAKQMRDREEMAKAHVREMNTLYNRMVEAFTLTISAKDDVTADHLNRVRLYCQKAGALMGLSAAEQQALDTASLLHDIGKLAVPERILFKPGRLTPSEFENIKQHPKVGAEILDRVGFPYPVVPIVRSHHEQWCGAGYPDGLRGDEIPVGARILSVVDCFDALASDRPYHDALPAEEVMRIIEADSGIRYDPRVVALLRANYKQWETEVRQSTSQLRLTDVAPVGLPAVPAAGFAHEE